MDTKLKDLSIEFDMVAFSDISEKDCCLNDDDLTYINNLFERISGMIEIEWERLRKKLYWNKIERFRMCISHLMQYIRSR